MSDENLPAPRTPDPSAPTPDATFETTSPVSILHLAPDAFVAAIADVPDAYLEMTEDALREEIWEGQMYAGRIENRLRVAFWKEYSRAVKRRHKMKLGRIYEGVCTEDHFLRLLKDVRIVAWILKRPPDFRTALAELLSLGVEEMREIMMMPVQLETGFVNTKLAELKFKIVEWASLREHGAPVQRVDQRNLNANYTRTVEDKTVTIKQGTGDSLPEDESDVQRLLSGLDEQLEALRAEAQQLEGGTNAQNLVKEVLPIERNIQDKGKS